MICITIFQVALAIPAGSNYEVTTINKCYGDIQLRVKGRINSTQINFLNCRLSKETFWLCRCRNPTIINFMTLNETRGEFDLIIQYNIEKPYGSISEQDSVRRTQKFNNFNIGEPIKQPFRWPAFGSTISKILFGFVMFFLFVIFGLVFFIKRLFFESDDEYNDEELNEILN